MSVEPRAQNLARTTLSPDNCSRSDVIGGGAFAAPVPGRYPGGCRLGLKCKRARRSTVMGASGVLLRKWGADVLINGIIPKKCGRSRGLLASHPRCFSGPSRRALSAGPKLPTGVSHRRHMQTLQRGAPNRRPKQAPQTGAPNRCPKQVPQTGAPDVLKRLGSWSEALPTQSPARRLGAMMSHFRQGHPPCGCGRRSTPGEVGTRAPPAAR